MQDKVEISTLNAYYGALLNDKQRELMNMYYDCDMSLAEVSEELGITRQAVRENVMRSVVKLHFWENKLGLAKKVKSLTNGLKELIEEIDSIDKTEITVKLKDILSNIEEI